ncbi:RHS repeat domain-containing protein [Pseudomonas sp. MYb118]|uniref:RHS repeat domain-containing protein n=1 Tax=Pseudomonas sp. MYb118 TaxID=1848720 RepID=UPI0034CD976C
MNDHCDTPTLAVVDPRSLAVRSVGYCRLPDEVDVESRVTRQVFDGVGRAVASWDPRLFGTSTKANQTTVYGLSGQPVLTESVDAGWQLNLMNHAGSLHSVWDGRGNQTRFEYDDQQRPLTVIEQMQVVDRFSYGDGTASRNKCGQLIRHDDPAGSGVIDDYGLLGTALVESRRFLKALETPDWPVDLEEREQWLEAHSYVTRHAFLPTGDVEHQTDAVGNVQSFVYDVAGSRRESWLVVTGKQPQCLINDVHYNALSQVEIETAGNGVRTQFFYGDDDGRLLRSVASVGTQVPLQDLNYTYDPVGNITELEDKAQSVTWFNSQRVEPINRYRYDSLYQLIEASGWEVSTPSHGPALPTLLPTPLDPNQRRNYTQRFDYDKSGNLITRHHSNAPSLSMFTSAHSNRSLSQREDGSLPGESDIDAGFDAAGNQLALQRGQVMTWDTRNQLSRVTLLSRNDDPGDDESYAYDRPGHRVRKLHISRTSRRALQEEVRYLPNLEIRRQADGEEHHVISVEAGRSSVRALHWPQGAQADQLRYSLSDHLGSSTLELDEKAGVLTQEYYYAFGGTACWAGKSELVAKYKINRYSGKERDATGLYYYGFRYLATWLQRWISPDPAGQTDGPNRYTMVRNNPVSFVDKAGLAGESFQQILVGLAQMGMTSAIGMASGWALGNAVLGLSYGALIGGLSYAAWSWLEYREAARVSAELAAEEKAIADGREASVLKLADLFVLSSEEAGRLVNFEAGLRAAHPDTRVAVSLLTKDDRIYAYGGPQDNIFRAHDIFLNVNNPARELKRLQVATLVIRNTPKDSSSIAGQRTDESQFGSGNTDEIVRQSGSHHMASADEVQSQAPDTTRVRAELKAVTIDSTVIDHILDNANDPNSAVLRSTLDEMLGRRFGAVKLHRHRGGLWAADLHGFVGSTGRGSKRLMFQKKGSHYKVMGITDPHPG